MINLAPRGEERFNRLDKFFGDMFPREFLIKILEPRPVENVELVLDGIDIDGELFTSHKGARKEFI